MNISNHSQDFQSLNEIEYSNSINILAQLQPEVNPLASTSPIQLKSFYQCHACPEVAYKKLSPLIVSSEDLDRQSLGQKSEDAGSSTLIKQPIPITQKQQNYINVSKQLDSHQSSNKKQNYTHTLIYNSQNKLSCTQQLQRQQTDEKNDKFAQHDNKFTEKDDNFDQVINIQMAKHFKAIISKLTQMKQNPRLSKYIYSNQNSSKQNTTTDLLQNICKYLVQTYAQYCPELKLQNTQPKQQIKQLKQSQHESLNPFDIEAQPTKLMNYNTYANLLSNFRTFSLQFFTQFFITTGYTSIPQFSFNNIIYDHESDKFMVSSNAINSLNSNQQHTKCYHIGFNLSREQLNHVSSQIHHQFTKISTKQDTTKRSAQDIPEILDYGFQSIKNEVTQDTLEILERFFTQKLHFLYSQKPQQLLIHNQQVQNDHQEPSIKKFKHHSAQQKYQLKLQQFKASVIYQLCYDIICYNFVRINWQFKRLLLKYTNFPEINPYNYACLSQCNNTIEESWTFQEKVNKSYMSQVLRSFKDIKVEIDCHKTQANQFKKGTESFLDSLGKKKSKKDQHESFSDLSYDREEWQNIDEVQEGQKSRMKESHHIDYINGSRSDCGVQQIQDSISEASFADLDDEKRSDFSILCSNTSQKINLQSNAKADNQIGKNQEESMFDLLSTKRQFCKKYVNQRLAQSNELSFAQSIEKSRKSCPARYYNHHQCHSSNKNLKLFQICLEGPYVLKGIFLQTLDEAAFAQQFKKVREQADFNVFTLLKNLCIDEQRIRKIELTRKFLIHLMQFQIQFISQMSSSENSALFNVWNCVRFVVLNLFSHLAKQIKLKVLKQLNETFLSQTSQKIFFQYLQNHDKRWKQTEQKIRMGVELSYQKILNYQAQMNDPQITLKRSNVKKLKQMRQRQPELFELIKNLNQGRIPTDKYDFELTQQIYQLILKTMKREIFNSTVIQRFYKKVKKNYEINDFYGQALFSKNNNKIQKARQEFYIFLLQITKIWNLITFLPFFSFQIQRQNVKRIQEKRRLTLETFQIEEILKNLDTIYIYQAKRLNNEMINNNPQKLQVMVGYFIKLFKSGREFFQASYEQKEQFIKIDCDNEGNVLHEGRLCMFGQQGERKYFMESVRKIFMGKKEEFFLTQQVLVKLLNI